MEKEPILYEIGYLLKSTLKEEEALVFSNKLKDEIAKQNGLATNEGKTKKLILSYPIRKETTAIFNWLRFKLIPEKIKEIKTSLDKNNSVLRFLIVKEKEESIIRPSIIKKPRKIEKPTKQGSNEKPKPEIKEEEIDKKIEELLGK